MFLFNNTSAQNITLKDNHRELHKGSPLQKTKSEDSKPECIFFPQTTVYIYVYSI